MKNRVRAVIIENNKILLIKRTKVEAIYWVFPGGGVEEGEDIKDALKRECKEELGIEVGVGELLIKVFSGKKETLGQLESFYLCDILSGSLGTGQGPEFKRDSSIFGTYDIEWVNIKDISKLNLYPEEAKNLIYQNEYQK